MWGKLSSYGSSWHATRLFVAMKTKGWVLLVFFVIHWAVGWHCLPDWRKWWWVFLLVVVIRKSQMSCVLLAMRICWRAVMCSTLHTYSPSPPPTNSPLSVHQPDLSVSQSTGNHTSKQAIPRSQCWALFFTLMISSYIAHMEIDTWSSWSLKGCKVYNFSCSMVMWSLKEQLSRRHDDDGWWCRWA